MKRLVLCLATLVLLALGIGCNSNSVTAPAPDPPVFIGDPVLSVDTTTAGLGTIRVRFLWQTDRASTDMVYFGAVVDSLNDSIAAQNTDTPIAGGTTVHGHVAPAAALAPASLPARQPFFYRLRALGANGQSGFSQVYRYVVSTS